MAATILKEGDELITVPSGDRVLYRDSSHRYWAVSDMTTEVVSGAKCATEPLIGVTTVTGCLDKPALLGWVETQTCEAVLALSARGLPSTADGLREFMRREKVGYQFTRDQAATRGTSVHDALERLATGGGVPRLADFPEADRGYVRALASFWLDSQPTTLATEQIVVSRELGVAGRYDLLAEIADRSLVVDAETGERDVIPAGTYRWDLKTSKRIYPVENFAQLAGYERLARDSGLPPSDGQIVIRLGEDGRYEVGKSTATPEDFLALLATYRMTRRLGAKRKPQPVPA